jgi:RNA polymerase sigma-70 factor (ECF subfamily)
MAVNVETGSSFDRLVERVYAGEHKGLAELFEHFRFQLETMIRLRMDAKVASRVDPADILQEAYLDACQQLSSFVASRSTSTNVYIWLRGIVFQRMLKGVRAHKGTQRRTVEMELSLPDHSSADLARMLVAGDPSPGKLVQAQELSEILKHAIEQMKEDDREVILLRHFENLSNREVAEVLGIRETTATMRYGRALVRLKEQLQRFNL